MKTIKLILLSKFILLLVIVPNIVNSQNYIGEIKQIGHECFVISKVIMNNDRIPIDTTFIDFMTNFDFHIKDNYVYTQSNYIINNGILIYINSSLIKEDKVVLLNTASIVIGHNYMQKAKITINKGKILMNYQSENENINSSIELVEKNISEIQDYLSDFKLKIEMEKQ